MTLLGRIFIADRGKIYALLSLPIEQQVCFCVFHPGVFLCSWWQHPICFFMSFLVFKQEIFVYTGDSYLVLKIRKHQKQQQIKPSQQLTNEHTDRAPDRRA